MFRHIQPSAVKALVAITLLSALVSACTTTSLAHCQVTLPSGLGNAMATAEEKLEGGCEYQFADYFDQMLAIAAENPSADNRRRFSDFLVRASDRGVISKRQARDLYNRYFNVKFVSLAGEYNTCSQTCPTRRKVLADMQAELADKELGLMKASEDSEAYHRADLLLQETQLVLEATCRACEAGAR